MRITEWPNKEKKKMNDTMRRQIVVFALALALAFALAPVYAQQPQPLNPPLKNWAAPLYWAPTPREAEQQRLEQRIAHPESSSPAIAQAAIFTPPGPMTFIAVTPCRVMDTRSTQPFTGAFGPPSLAAFGTARQVPLPTSTTCSIPSNAGAYSLNITVVPPGPMSFLSVWPAGAPYPGVSTLNDPVAGGVIANAAIIVAGTSGAIQMLASNPTDVIIDINGYYAAPTDVGGNTAVGTGALGSLAGGNYNTATGASALANNTTGNSNTASGYYALESNTTGSDNTASGNFALQANTTGNNNTASGSGALQANTAGNNNTASGSGALGSNTAGSSNTASGSNALNANTIGIDNTASGLNSLLSNTTGNSNTASGYLSLYRNSIGNYNTAGGVGAMGGNTTGSNNTASGYYALYNNTTGSNNIAIGPDAAFNVLGGNSNNIDIGSLGASGDSGVIRIGTAGAHTSTFIAGINGATPGTPNLLICVDGNGQLGTTGCSSTPSSQRFKQQIADMGDSSSKLLQLRAVTFFYKPQYDDGSHALQYGLIAEEVAKVYPDMVGYDKDGQPTSVKYQLLTPMLLNEVQKQNAQIQTQAEAIQFQQEENRKLEDRLAALEALLSSQTSTAVRPARSQ